MIYHYIYLPVHLTVVNFICSIMLNIIIFGAPGAGKGTQSEFIIDRYKLRHLSTGDMLRAAIAEKTPAGLNAKNYIDKGQLVPDEIVIEMIANDLDSHHEVPGFIFDGFPRTNAQADKLDQMLLAKGCPITTLIALEVEQEELIKRLLNRGKISNRTDDQDENVIRNRIKVYEANTLPVMDHYKKQNKYHGILGMGTIEDISKRIAEAIDSTK